MLFFFCSSRRRLTRCALVTGVQTCALPIYLIEVQRSSYDQFLQMNIAPEAREHLGLQEVFRSVFPIKVFSERAELDFVHYELEQPKYDVEECQQTGRASCRGRGCRYV